MSVYFSLLCMQNVTCSFFSAVCSFCLFLLIPNVMVKAKLLKELVVLYGFDFLSSDVLRKCSDVFFFCMN